MSPCQQLLTGLLIIALLSDLIGCTQSPPSLPNDAYIWQRQWTSAVETAMQGAGSSVRTWRVLGGEIDANGKLQLAHVSYATLTTANRPIVLVVRIDGQLAKLDTALLRGRISTIFEDWRAHGVIIAGLEIDHDCGTQHLSAYAAFLAKLRKAVAPIKLSITALPDWANSAFLPALLDETDAYVIQVHAVRNPKHGLFEASQAMAWVEAFGRASAQPFQIALPNYGSRVSWNARGEIVGIESETPSAVLAAESRELVAYPSAVQDFLRQLRRNPPSHLAGIAWFRLPVEADQRTWEAATWQAVMQDRYIPSPAQVQLQRENSGMYKVFLDNLSQFDTELPRAVSLDATCVLGDGANGYVFEEDRRRLSRQQAGLLHPGSHRIIGWLRCDTNKKIEAHAEI